MSGPGRSGTPCATGRWRGARGAGRTSAGSPVGCSRRRCAAPWTPAGRTERRTSRACSSPGGPCPHTAPRCSTACSRARARRARSRPWPRRRPPREARAARAFGAPDAPADEAWQLAWDGDAKELDTMAGQPPAGEMEIYGLTAPERKVAHQLAQVLGLHSESRECDELLAEVAGGGGKAVAWRPPRSRQERAGRPGGGPWSPPFSVSQVL